MYPPCDTQRLVQFDLEKPRESIVLSIAQFRPEKNHVLQLEAFRKLIDSGVSGVKLVLVGSSRNEEDARRVADLRATAEQLGLAVSRSYSCLFAYSFQNYVEFAVNATYEQLLAYLSKASVGIHTMTQEHFGIGIIEYMAAGVIPVAHNSGGPKMDIIVDYNGKRVGESLSSDYP